MWLLRDYNEDKMINTLIEETTRLRNYREHEIITTASDAEVVDVFPDGLYLEL